MYYFSTLRELSLSAGGRLRMSADTAAHFRSQVRECASTVSAPSLARADDGGVGVNARRSGVARRRPGPQSSKYSTLSSSSSAPCLFASMASILRCVCTTLVSACLLCLSCKRAVRSTACVARFRRHLMHFFARMQRPSQTGAFAFFFVRTFGTWWAASGWPECPLLPPRLLP